MFVNRRRGTADPSGWTPFEPSDNFTSRWWEGQSHNKDPWYVQVIRDGDEVGRVELLPKDGLNPSYGVDPHLASTALEIRFFEVSSTCRRQGIGRAIIRELEAQHPDRALAAYSMNADDFWASLGWQRYDIPNERGPRSSPLFVQR